MKDRVFVFFRNCFSGCLALALFASMVIPMPAAAAEQATFPLETLMENPRGVRLHLRGMDTDCVIYDFVDESLTEEKIWPAIRDFTGRLRDDGYRAERSPIDWWGEGDIVLRNYDGGFSIDGDKDYAAGIINQLFMDSLQIKFGGGWVFDAFFRGSDGKKGIEVIHGGPRLQLIYSPASSAPYGYVAYVASLVADSPSPSASASAGGQAGGGRELPAQKQPAAPDNAAASALEYYIVLEANDGNTYTFRQNYGKYDEYKGNASVSAAFEAVTTDAVEKILSSSSHMVSLSFPAVSAGTVLTAENANQFPPALYKLDVRIEPLGRWNIQAEPRIENGKIVNRFDPAWGGTKAFRITIDSVENGVYTGTLEISFESESFSTGKTLTHAKGPFRFTVK